LPILKVTVAFKTPIAVKNNEISYTTIGQAESDAIAENKGLLARISRAKIYGSIAVLAVDPCHCNVRY